MKPTLLGDTAVPTRAPGRPFDESRHAAILASAFALLADVGYERLTIEAVALHAGTSKATVYRRWPGKAALVVDALRSRTPDPAWDDTGSLRGDLLAALTHMVEFMESSEGRVALSLSWAMQTDPTLAATLRTCMLEEKGTECRRVIDRAVARGEITDPGPATELLPMTIFGVLHANTIVGGRPAGTDFLVDVVDRVLLPILGVPCPTPASPPISTPAGISPSTEHVIPTPTTHQESL